MREKKLYTTKISNKIGICCLELLLGRIIITDITDKIITNIRKKQCNIELIIKPNFLKSKS